MDMFDNKTLNLQSTQEMLFPSLKCVLNWHLIETITAGFVTYMLAHCLQLATWSLGYFKSKNWNLTTIFFQMYF